MSTDEFVVHEHEVAPEKPPQGPWVWARENLFSSAFNAVLSILFIVAIVLFVRQLVLGWVLDDARRFEAVWTNMRLYMVQAYPADQMIRVWVAVSTVVALAGMSMAVYRVGGRMSARTLLRIGMGVGGAVAFGAIIAKGDFGTRLVIAVGAAGIASACFAVNRALGERAKTTTFHTLAVFGGVIVAAIVILWTVPFGRFTFDSVERIARYEPGVVSETTRMGWLAVAIVAFASYFVARALMRIVPEKALRGVVMVGWVLSLPTIVLIILRDPDWNVGNPMGGFDFLAGTDVWLFLVFGGLGALFIFLTSWPPVGNSQGLHGALVLLGALVVAAVPLIMEIKSDRLDGGLELDASDIVLVGGVVVALFIAVGVVLSREVTEPGKAAAAIVMIGALMLWATPFLMRGRLIATIAALFVVGAPSFAGDKQSRLRYIGLWIGTLAALVFFLAAINTPTSLIVPGKSFLGGLALTFVLALTSILLSFPIGVLMALGRTSTMPIFRVMSTVYIELVRGIPFITVLIFFDLILVLFLPPGLSFNSVTLAILGGTLFSAAYLAENVRGGLQSIPNGQYEASKAMGLTTLQSTVFIVLPQALRAVIPALVGQTIAIFKDTSLVAIIGLFDFLFIADKVIPAQTVVNEAGQVAFLGTKLENILFISVVYWIFTFSFSRASLRIEKKVGLGER
jgi:His/Glu/Gln/Arg/opine family amino acid ABC transporter permease subunit